MDDPPAMGVLEGLGDLRPDSNEGFEGVPVGRDALRQRAAVEKLHGDVDVVVRLAGFVDVADVWMAEA